MQIWGEFRQWATSCAGNQSTPRGGQLRLEPVSDTLLRCIGLNSYDSSASCCYRNVTTGASSVWFYSDLPCLPQQLKAKQQLE
jgi:hypothetical protein